MSLPAIDLRTDRKPPGLRTAERRFGRYVGMPERLHGQIVSNPETSQLGGTSSTALVAESNAPPKRRRRRKLYLRAAVSLTLLVLVLRLVPLQEVTTTLASVRLPWLAAALATFIAQRFLAVLRWQYALGAEGVRVSFFDLTRITFMSSPIGQLLPGGLGADLARGAQLARETGRGRAATASILVDRAFGAYSMLLLASVMVGVSELSGRPTGWLVFLGAFQIVVVAGAGAMFLLRSQLIRWRAASTRHRRLNGLVDSVVALSSPERVRRVFVVSLFLSVVVQCVRCAMFWCIYRACGSNPDFVTCLTFVPLVFFLVLLPISLNGLGVREGALVYFFADAGVPARISISAGLICHLFSLLLALVGAVWILLDRRGTGDA